MLVLAKEYEKVEARLALTNPRPESDPAQRSYLSGQMTHRDSDHLQRLHDALHNAVRAACLVSPASIKKGLGYLLAVNTRSFT